MRISDGSSDVCSSDLSTEIAEVPQDLLDLADRSGDNAPTRRDEPYRRAISGIYARLAATHERLCGKVPPRPSALAAEPYGSPDELRHDLAIIETGLKKTDDALASGGAIDRLIRSVATFGFHLATLVLRKNSKIHERR